MKRLVLFLIAILVFTAPSLAIGERPPKLKTEKFSTRHHIRKNMKKHKSYLCWKRTNPKKAAAPNKISYLDCGHKNSLY